MPSIYHVPPERRNLRCLLGDLSIELLGGIALGIVLGLIVRFLS